MDCKLVAILIWGIFALCFLARDVSSDDSTALPTGQSSSNVEITSVHPQQLQITTSSKIELIVQNLPPGDEKLFCTFTFQNKTLKVDGTRSNSSVICVTPKSATLPPIPNKEFQSVAKLSLSTNDVELAATNFKYFDCNRYISCTSCVSSAFPCDWCVDGHRCTHDTAENCRNDILVTGVNRGGPSYRSGPTFCPTINAATDGSSEILVPADTKKSIRVKIHIIGQFIVQTRFLCQFNIEGRVTSVNADLIGDTIYCEVMEFAYTQRGPNMTATFAVIWGGSKPLDNPDYIHVVIYRCRDMADNCGMCLMLEKKYGCGWCQSTNRCEISSQCDSGSGGWLDQNHTCPNPSIVNFRPQLGPWEGGTNVTIQGINLGKTFADVYSGITVAGIPCEPYESLYKPTREIVCRVYGPGTTEVRKGPVMVKVENFRGVSKQQFTFVDPKIEDISPKRGPTRGGTELTIKGKYMNAGSLIEVFIDELPCKVFFNDSTEMKCIASASNKQRKGKVTVKFDGGIRIYGNHPFEYTDDRIIESLESGVNSLDKVPEGIPPRDIRNNDLHSNCSSYASCTSCVSSPFPCDWCVDGHLCTNDVNTHCPNDILVNGVSHKCSSYHTGPEFCPKIDTTEGKTLPVPADTRRSISVEVRNVGLFMANSEFFCNFNINGQTTSVNARFSNNIIYCDEAKFSFEHSGPYSNGSLIVTWGDSKALDNPKNIRIVIYKCDQMANDDFLCSALNKRYSCTWCENTNKCQFGTCDGS